MNRTKRLSIGVAMFATAWVIPSSVSADVISIGAAKDNTIFQNATSNSLGGGQSVFAGTNTGLSPRRGLMMFDVAGSIPAGSTITGVQLTLFLSQVAGSGMGGGGGSPTIDMLRLAAEWGEGTAGSHVNGAGGTGGGFAAADGDATWSARLFSATTPTLWTTPGGDFAATPSASLTIVGTTVDLPYTWTSTPDLVSDVQDWLDTPATNFGWMLKNQDETNAQTFRAFWTREAARTNQSAFAPQLQITFTPVPEPAAGILLLGCVVLGARGRTRA